MYNYIMYITLVWQVNTTQSVTSDKCDPRITKQFISSLQKRENMRRQPTYKMLKYGTDCFPDHH